MCAVKTDCGLRGSPLPGGSVVADVVCRLRKLDTEGLDARVMAVQMGRFDSRVHAHDPEVLGDAPVPLDPRRHNALDAVDDRSETLRDLVEFPLPFSQLGDRVTGGLLLLARILR